jgi:phosphatidate cytidylyltransferase
MLRQRVITAVILLILFLAALFSLPALGWVMLVVVIVMQATLEWARLSKLPGHMTNAYWWGTLVIIAALVWLDEARHPMLHMAVYMASLILWVAVVPLWLWLKWKLQSPLVMAAVGWGVIIPTGLAMIDLRQSSPWILLGIMALVWVADSAAYFTGRKFGKTKLAPSISPGKTWEGVIGALLGVSLYVVLAWSASPYSQLMRYLPNVLIASWCWVGLAVVGDLFESAIKRQAGVKDSGELLPGHGGLLDRIDALTSTLPLAALAMLLQRMP